MCIESYPSSCQKTNRQIEKRINNFSMRSAHKNVPFTSRMKKIKD